MELYPRLPSCSEEYPLLSSEILRQVELVSDTYVQGRKIMIKPRNIAQERIKQIMDIISIDIAVTLTIE